MNPYLRVLAYAKPYGRHLCAAMLCMVVFSLSTGATVWVALPFLQTLFAGETAPETVMTPAADPLEEKTGIAAWRET
ncbi:MAG: hypothetical protein FJY97_17850, partial [candidate division Zixibacteria bacterium]|nr:hypothetical protein [candidate division Zixibacteria bacterium]